ncbi:hypothetical protein OSL57_26220, partial [Escherichia coli]|nr:hypothetical protein [Escherichia coli]
TLFGRVKIDLLLQAPAHDRHHIRERPAQARDFRYDQRITPFHLTEQSPKFAVLFPFAATGHFRNPVVYDPIPTLGETPDLVLLVARI